MVQPKLSDNLILFKYILSKYFNNSKNLKEVSSDNLNTFNKEGFNEDGESYFVQELLNNIEGNFREKSHIFLDYDKNIFNHLKKINSIRSENITLKYFQYLSLIFTEIYLDNYFRDKNDFIKNINNFVNEKEYSNEYKYSIEDLNKVAYWMATGSGKTIILHINILQIKYYIEKYKIRDFQDRYLLVTPNESLTKQHVMEFKESGLNASELNTRNTGLFANSDSLICVIDINKLREKEGDKTIAVESLGDNNIVFVDEGHRGVSGDSWKEMRDMLSHNGFCFEYSATFGQAIKFSNDKNKKEVFYEYSKSILFDYSYKYFFEDGFGKDYSIVNITNDNVENNLNLYFTANFLTFIQQLIIFHENQELMKTFNISEPLMVFVGNSVIGKIENREDKISASDVTKIVNFLDYFTNSNYKDQILQNIKNILEGNSGLVDSQGKDLYMFRLNYLRNKFTDRYEDLLSLIFKLFFNSNTLFGRLQITNLKGQDGELGLSISNSTDYFGIINIGDVSGFLKHLEKNSKVYIEPERVTKSSYFDNINSKSSSIQLLIGSKKFTEGWNSWRVSTLGFLNLGKSEGSQVIQLFGRGVRLKGFKNSLKRSSKIEKELIQNIIIPEYLKYSETINVFGVKADYISTFKDYLQSEDINTDSKYLTIKLPTIKSQFNSAIKTINVPFKSLEFKKKEFYTSNELSTEIIESLKYSPIYFNTNIKLQTMDGNSDSGVLIEDQSLQIPSFILETASIDDIFLKLQEYKAEKGLWNISISRELVKDILKNLIENQNIIEIKGRPDFFNSVNSFKDILIIHDQFLLPIFQNIIKKINDNLKENYETKLRKYSNVSELKDTFVEEYEFQVSEKQIDVINEIKLIADSMITNSDILLRGNSKIINPNPLLQIFTYNKHLYNPIINYDELSDEFIKVRPIGLNNSETRFLMDLKKYTSTSLNDDFPNSELFIIRNQSKGSGIGFYEANNFYPDFILWFLINDFQYITFIDPKGLRNMRNGFRNPKIQFKNKIKEIQNQLSINDNKNIILNSFIITETNIRDIDWSEGRSEDYFNENNIFFMDSSNNYIKKILKKIIS